MPASHRIDSFILRRTAAWLACMGLAATLAACSKGESTKTSQVVAKVNSQEISVHQVNYVLERQQGVKPEQVDGLSRQILERLVDQEIAVQRAGELKLDRDPKVMQTLEAARKDILARAYADSVAAAVTKPTADAVKAYYDGKPALFAQRRVYALEELQVQADAQQLASLREHVGSAKSMKDVTDYIKDAKLPARGNRNVAAAESLPMPLLERFAQMKPGQAMFLPAPGGARIVVVADAKSEPVTLQQATPMIERAVYNEARAKLLEEDRKTQRKAAKVELMGKFAQAPMDAASGAASGATSTAAPVTEPAPQPAAAAASSAVDAATLEKGMAGLK